MRAISSLSIGYFSHQISTCVLVLKEIRHSFIMNKELTMSPVNLLSMFFQQSSNILTLYLSVTVSQGGVSSASDMCPDPGIPENGRRVGSDFR